MAIKGKDNVIELLRMQNTPYWRIAESEKTRAAGNYVATAGDHPDLSIENSLDTLRRTLDRFTPGRYLLTAFREPSGKRGGVDTAIEVEGGGLGGSIGSTGPAQIYIEGIGNVDPANLGQAIDDKISLIRKKEKEELDIKNLREENRRLKIEAKQSSAGFQKGIITLGAVLFDSMKGTQSGKQIMALAAKATSFVGQQTETTTEATGNVSNEVAVSGTEEAEIGTSPSGAEERITAALQTMLAGKEDSPDAHNELAEQLELMARVKRDNPAMFEMGLQHLKTLS